MQIVINIDNNLYTRLFDNGETDAADMLKACTAIRKGDVLSQGHGLKTMAKLPTYEEMAKKVAEEALDEYIYKGKTLREWIDILRQTRWIPVSERLPEERGLYLVSMNRLGYPQRAIDGFIRRRWERYGNAVLAWMPLPEPYKETRRMTREEIDCMKYKVCCPMCDNEKCVKGTDKCEAEIWAKDKEVEDEQATGEEKAKEGNG